MDGISVWFAAFMIYLTISGLLGHDVFLPIRVKEDDSVILNCEGSPQDGKKWIFNDQLIFTSTYPTHQFHNIRLVDSNYSLILRSVTYQNEGVYNCSRNSITIVIYDVTVEATPQLKLLFNDQTFTGVTSSYDYAQLKGESYLKLRCEAVGSRPPASLTWVVNGEDVNHSDVYNVLSKPNLITPNTFDSESTIYLQSVGSQVNVSCQHIGLEILSRNLTINIRIIEETVTASEDGEHANNNSESPSENKWIITACIVLAIVGLIVMAFGLATLIQRKDFRVLQISRAQENNTDDEQSLSAETSANTSSNEKRHSVARGKRRSPNDVKLISKLPGDGCVTTWTATSSIDSSNETIFVARSITDQAKVADLYNFKECAGFLSTLDKHKHLVHFLGAAVDNAPYFIYQEYVDCGSVRDFLLRNFQQEHAVRDDPYQNGQKSVLVKDKRQILMTFIRDIARGMDYLISKRYRHPALSASKVLLTELGFCKLYDFWPECLVTHRIQQINDKKPRPVAWLAPETLFLEEYSDKSDVWSYGVVLWEICSMGETPFVGKTCEEIESLVRRNECLSQPLSCPGALYGIMLSSWERNLKKRPTFKSILKQMKAIPCSTLGTTDQIQQTRNDEVNEYFTLEMEGESDGSQLAPDTNRRHPMSKSTKRKSKKLEMQQRVPSRPDLVEKGNFTNEVDDRYDHLALSVGQRDHHSRNRSNRSQPENRIPQKQESCSIYYVSLTQ